MTTARGGMDGLKRRTEKLTRYSQKGYRRLLNIISMYITLLLILLFDSQSEYIYIFILFFLSVLNPNN